MMVKDSMFDIISMYKVVDEDCPSIEGSNVIKSS